MRIIIISILTLQLLFWDFFMGLFIWLYLVGMNHIIRLHYKKKETVHTIKTVVYIDLAILMWIFAIFMPFNLYAYYEITGILSMLWIYFTILIILLYNVEKNNK